MAKRSMVQREIKRAKLAARFADKRAKLKLMIKDPSLSFTDKMDAIHKLQSLPRDSSPVRKRNRCQITGRPRGFYRKFGISRNKLREHTMFGNVPGLNKASW